MQLFPLLVVALAQGGDTLSLAHAVVLARAHNPRLAAAASRLDAAGARIGPAGALPDPAVTLGAMNYMWPSFSPSGDPMSMTQVSVSQALPVNGTLGLKRAAAREDSAATAYARDALRLGLERDVRARYWELYHTDRALSIMTGTRGVLRDLAEVAASMYGVGATPQADVVRAQLAVTRMQQEIADMEVMRFSAAAALNTAMGRNAETPVVLPGLVTHELHGDPAHRLHLPAISPVDSLMALALEGNPELLAAGAVVRSAEAGEAAARRSIWPDLGIGAAYGQRVGDADMVSLMVSVNVPVFARSRQFRMRDEARAMVAEAGHARRALSLEIRAALATERARAETARGQVALYAGSIVPQAEAAYEAALAAYRSARSDFPAVLESRMALLSYQHDLHRFEAAYGTALAEIDRLIGRPYAAPGS